MKENRLKMNPTKTEVICFGSEKLLKKCRMQGVSIVGVNIEKTGVIRFLGAWLDYKITMKTHVQEKTVTANWNFLKFMPTCNVLDQPTCEFLVHSLVIVIKSRTA